MLNEKSYFNILNRLIFLLLFIALIDSCNIDKRIEFSPPDRLGIESGSSHCTEFANFRRWYAFYGLWKISKYEPELPKHEGKVYYFESYATWKESVGSLLMGVVTSISVQAVKVSECDTGTRFVHKDQYDAFFETEKEKAKQELYAKVERELEESLKKYLEKVSPAEHAGKNYSTIVFRTGRVQEARVVGQDVDTIQIEWDEGEQKKESSLLKKDIYKVIFATKIIRVKETSEPKEVKDVKDTKETKDSKGKGQGKGR
ncbi:LIC_13076 family protein [Leptospira perolatii]|uniref:LIC_13076 family protein n=1 Tax=Leptospira perolatii TaxID=2023191 RepID=UPI001FAF9B01|nr:hypothetical protein [Leptospira perolatii]